MKNIGKNLSKSSFLVLLVVLIAIIVRLPFMVVNSHPFSFDHGKDSLAVMHLVETLSPKLIGPWTSIPGLYFGPGWYYLLAPAYLIFGGSPTGFVIWMSLLVIATVYLVARWFGFLPAVILATGTLSLIISQSAWNPFPVPLIMFGLIYVLRELKKDRDNFRPMKRKWIFLAGILVGSIFHFSSALAIFLAIGVFLLIAYTRKDLLNLVFYILGIGILFIPQLIFELRHDFPQATSLTGYFSSIIEAIDDESEVSQPRSMGEILSITWGEMRLAVLPDSSSLVSQELQVQTLKFMEIALVALIGLSIWNRSFFSFPYWKEVGVIGGISLLGFTLIHFNYWYILGFAPFVVLFVAHILRSTPRWMQIAYVALMVTSAVMFSYHFLERSITSAQENRELLPVKVLALDTIYEIADGRVFSSFHYVPDIYDFSYQYLYFWYAKQGHQLPFEFGYKPDVVPYVVEKPELLHKFSPHVPQEQPEVLFYLVEKAQNQEFLSAWWGDQRYGEITEEITISQEVTLFVATPIEHEMIVE